MIKGNISHQNIHILKWASACILAVLVLFGCKQTMNNPQPSQDVTPPAEVTELKAVAGNGKVSLSWKNPGDADLNQVEISAEPAEGTLKKPVYLAAKKGENGSFMVEGLANGTGYTFTVKTIDKALNKSAGVKLEKTVKQGDPTSIAYSDLDAYLKNTASSTAINYITVTGLTADLVEGKGWDKGYRIPSPLGKILKAHSDKRVALTLTALTALGDNAFVDCISLTSVTMPEGITAIGNGAFKRCTALTEITIPDTVEWIRSKAFSDCISLKNVTIPDSVTYMSNGAFENCTSLTSVHIPSGVTEIGWSAFQNCTKLTAVHLPASLTNIQDNPFSGCENLTTITIDSTNPKYDCKDNVVYDKNSNSLVFAARGVTGSITIPNGITTIGNNAFFGCTKLENVTIPESVTAIYNHAFFDCKSLVSITIPKSVMYINKNAFGGCTNAEIVLSEDISNAIYIEGAAFGTYDRGGPAKR